MKEDMPTCTMTCQVSSSVSKRESRHGVKMRSVTESCRKASALQGDPRSKRCTTKKCFFHKHYFPGWLAVLVISANADKAVGGVLATPNRSSSDGKSSVLRSSGDSPEKESRRCEEGVAHWRCLAKTSPDIIVSKVLSLGVVLGACIGKFPQIHAILEARSANGLSRVSMWTEALSMSIQLSYNVVHRTPLSTYAEVAIILPQLLLLILVAAWADGYLKCRTWLGCLSLVLFSVAMSLQVVPSEITAGLYAATCVLAFVAVTPQIALNFRNKSTGQLSFVVTAMTFTGMSTRLFTTFVEVEDVQVKATMALNWVLMSILMSQFLLYRHQGEVQAHSPTHDPWTGTSVCQKLKRHRTVMDLASAVGTSSRCLTDVVDNEVLEETMQVIHANSSKSLMHYSSSFSSFHRQGSLFSLSELSCELGGLGQDALGPIELGSASPKEFPDGI
eukprot:TRINITY_DN110668_c0_g1_i1.p1 TRINITY_DN110668_c0_g1~~TRINITY_DN110668_c0_g1_i1.p1  ORF type:complete len:446 (-),score=56.86 TRINITY_DN110668_c0_g1_i1:337-1674(-)